MCSSTSKRRSRMRARAVPAAPRQPERLSMVINSTPGSRLIRRASIRPITQVMRVSGQACCSVRTIGTTWQVSPMAEKRSMQRLRGGVSGIRHALGFRWHAPMTRKLAGRPGSARRSGCAAARCYMTAPAGSKRHRGMARARPGGRGAAACTPSTGGRGAACFIEADGRNLVLRHYRRGGLIARLSADRYLWRGADAHALASPSGTCCITCMHAGPAGAAADGGAATGAAASSTAPTC